MNAHQPKRRSTISDDSDHVKLPLLTNVSSSSSSSVGRKKSKQRKKRSTAKRSSLSTAAIFLFGFLGGLFLTSCAIYICFFSVLASPSLRNSAGTDTGTNTGRLQLSSIKMLNNQHHSHHHHQHHHHRHHDDNSEEEEDKDKEAPIELPWNPIYKVPGASPYVGDRSDHYARLRSEIDPLLPNDAKHSIHHNRKLAAHTYEPYPMNSHRLGRQEPYDIYNCPDNPPTGYPFDWKIVHILHLWPSDDTIPRSMIHQSLCIFDYEKDYDKAVRYREAELPFIVVNDPAVAKTVHRWSVRGYLSTLLGDEEHMTEYSENNHFLYSNMKELFKHDMDIPRGWEPPTEMTMMSFGDFLDHALVPDERLGPNQPHWYYRLTGCGLDEKCAEHTTSTSEYLFDELPFFQPKETLYVVEPEKQEGIQCHFGMKGVIAENHFDSSRNAIALLGGSRRYVLAHPDQCEKLALFPQNHPSARHSEVDWSDPDLQHFPQFAHARGNEVVLQPGQVMYLPIYWFHYIISLELNYQCNTRSGVTLDYAKPIDSCGFLYKGG